MMVNCSPGHLWPFLHEPEKQKLWMKGLQANVATNDVKGVGHTFRMTIKEGRRTGDYDGEVTAYDEPRHLAVRFWGGGFPKGAVMNVDYRLTAVTGQTKLDYVARMEGAKFGFFLRLLMPLFKLFGRMQLRRFFKKLKQLAEAPAQAA
jgi:carbon monoxide dehydrogenase subunit G